MSTTQQTAAAPTTFESEPCSRCHGSGKYSYCQMYGDTCFKCRGKGLYLTKRGEAASRYLSALRSKRADAIQPGDVVLIPGGGPFPSTWMEVQFVGWYDNSGCRSFIGGVEQPRRNDLLKFFGAKSDYSGLAPESMVRVRQNKEASASTFAAALAYQATLTKAGTPRKVAKPADAVATA